MVDHDVVVPLHSAVEDWGGLDASVEPFEFPYRVTGIENDNVVEFRWDDDVVGDNGTATLTGRYDPQIAMAELQERTERHRVDTPAEQLAVTTQLELGQGWQVDHTRGSPVPLLCV
jgi:hypothetical protein